MDSNATTEQLPTGETEIGDRDIISQLHESVHGQILSFLPTMEAVRTCVLSRRWINSWTSITGFHFDDGFHFSKKKMPKRQFVNFVNRVLLCLTNSSIQSLSLCLTRYQYDESQISTWIYFILERRVQKLHIQYANKVFVSSHSLFRCSSLVELVLHLRCTLSVPKSACLPNLEKLSLSGITLASESLDCSKDLTLSFPSLKIFEARGCQWSTVQNISIQVPLLEKFSIEIWNYSLSNESCTSAIKIFSLQLTDFSYKGDLEQGIILYDSSSIRNASVVIVNDEDKKDRMEKLGVQANTLLRQVHGVERLKLLFYKALKHGKDIFTNLPAFGRLTHLQLNEVTGEALLHLLLNSPNLNTLVLLNGVYDINKDALASASVPHCFLSSFKVFQFKGYNVKEEELCLVKFVMANAALLERMTVSPSFWLRYTDIDMEKVKEQILSLPKCSSLCMTDFSDISGF